MKIALITPENWLLELAKELSKTHEVFINECLADCDLIFCTSVSMQDKAIAFHRLYPQIPVANYVWDLYEWCFTRPREWEANYDLYGEFLRESKFVWSSSKATQSRLRQFYKVDSEVIYTFVPIFEYEVEDKGYVYQPLREQPDRDWGMLEEVCEELGLKVETHATPYERYQEVIAGCNLIVSPLYEASTGSLSLVEGAYIGKPCLVSDSPYNGGNEYLAGVPTFKAGDREDLKKKILENIPHTPITRDYSVGRMAKEICRYISQLPVK